MVNFASTCFQIGILDGFICAVDFVGQHLAGSRCALRSLAMSEKARPYLSTNSTWRRFHSGALGKEGSAIPRKVEAQSLLLNAQ